MEEEKEIDASKYSNDLLRDCFDQSLFKETDGYFLIKSKAYNDNISDSFERAIAIPMRLR